MHSTELTLEKLENAFKNLRREIKILWMPVWKGDGVGREKII